MAQKSEREIIAKTKRELDEIIPRYALNKQELDDYKKLCDEDNKIIKQHMKTINLDVYGVDNIIVEKRISVTESFDEEKLIGIMKDAGLCSLVKTKTIEYIDYDGLESMIYNERLDEETIQKIASCKQSKEKVSLYVKTKKESKDGE